MLSSLAAYPAVVVNDVRLFRITCGGYVANMCSVDPGCAAAGEAITSAGAIVRS